VSQYSGLRVYNSENGKLIGVDKNFCGNAFGRNILYKDYLITTRFEKDNPDKAGSVVVAVNVGK
jgi:hypothetical protein